MKNLRHFIFGTQSHGFALVSTVAVMVLLLVLALGFLSLAAIESRSLQQGEAMAEARANARAALMMAIGQLQETMGPDTRISARAEILAMDDRLNVPVSSATPKAFWVGVSSSDRTQSVDAANSRGILWLVSGLDVNATPAAQLASAQSFEDPVTMFGDGSIDTANMTGGRDIEAGKIRITNPTSSRPGKIAWFVDDEGMKAQLAATRPEVSNDLDDPHGRGLIPGTYDLSVLENMAGIAGHTPDEYSRLLSTNDLPFLGAGMDLVRNKRMSYTTASRGVLSDTKDGGLKKDLTVAFENDQVFSDLWGDGRDSSSGSYSEDFILMDPEKFAQCSDLQAHGYIHWDMLRDYYNLKRHIRKDPLTPSDYLDISQISTEGISNYSKSMRQGAMGNFIYGRLGPHQIGNNANVPDHHKQVPYGDYMTATGPDTRRDGTPVLNDQFKHSPITPVLMRMQQNGWLETVDKADGTYLQTNGQLWFSQYNPYNIGIRVVGWNWDNGAVFKGYSALSFDHPGITVEVFNNQGDALERPFINNYRAFLGRRQVSTPDPVLLGPGRSHVYGFERDVNNESDSQSGYYSGDSIFGENVRDLTMESAQQEYKILSHAPGDLSISAAKGVDAFVHGGSGYGNEKRHWSVAQAFWAPYSWDDFCSWKAEFDDVGLDDLNENLMASFSFHLRTSNEPSSGGSSAIRPLVDSNIRAMLTNPRWDSPLGLQLPAAYSIADGGTVDEQIMQMDTRDSPKGYAYWGAGRDPVDGYDRVILFDVPREDLVSIGQLQHANVGRFSYEPSYIIGNSYANLRIPQEQWREAIADTFSTSGGPTFNGHPIAGNFNLYDASYLVNEVLWDGATFTTIPQVADNYGSDSGPDPTENHFEALMSGDAFLANPRFLPYEPTGSNFSTATLQQDPNAYHHNAGHVIVDGAFNVNSTSVDAWEAFLSGTRGLPYLKVDGAGEITGFATDAEGVRFPRLLASIGGPMKTASIDENYWTGFRSLTSTEVRELATEIVEQIKRRGPFLTMGEFVNRKLESGELGQSGALQAALDNTVNSNIDSNFSGSTSHSGIPTNSKQGAGFAGHLQQGDILQALAPFMTVRSDTFTIRAYGETLSPDGGKVLARAWCEATVQRFPDPVPAPAGGDILDQLANPSSIFGRRFRVTSFRWLNANEI